MIVETFTVKKFTNEDIYEKYTPEYNSYLEKLEREYSEYRKRKRVQRLLFWIATAITLLSVPLAHYLTNTYVFIFLFCIGFCLYYFSFRVNVDSISEEKFNSTAEEKFREFKAFYPTAKDYIESKYYILFLYISDNVLCKKLCINGDTAYLCVDVNDNGIVKKGMKWVCDVRITCDMCELQSPEVDLLEDIVYVPYKLKEKIFAEV